MNNIKDTATPKSMIAWMAHNHVAANLLMLIFLVGGYLCVKNIKQEVFPEISYDRIAINVAYPGAGPEEIENGILLSIESRVRGVDGIKRITSTAREGSGTVVAELFDFFDTGKVLQDIKNEIDRITTFPENAEKPTVTLQISKRIAVSIMVYGNQSPELLQTYAEQVKNDLISQKGITLAELAAARPLEVAVEVSQQQLRDLNLTLEDIARQISLTAQEIPAGGLKTTAGEVLIRIDERRLSGPTFANIPILSNPQGGTVTLGDIASITDSFTDNDQEVYFNGLPAVKINVYSVGKESPVSVAKIAKQYIEQHTYNNTDTLKLAIFQDRSEVYRGRIQLLMKNALMGLVLVLIILGLFLNAKLAFWVMLGLPISILGSFVFFQFTGATLNLVSLFAFIITLGIVVDDAVIVGESIYEKRQQGLSRLEAAVFGAKEMLMPVTFAVLTNIIAFMPLLFVPGTMGDIFRQIPAVVMSVLAVSLIECLFILPAHLNQKEGSSHWQIFWDILNKPQKKFGRWLEIFTHNQFRTIITKVIDNRYLTISICIGILIISIGLLKSGLLAFSFLPRVDRDTINANATLPYGVPIEESRKIMQTLIDSAYHTVTESGEPNILKGLYAAIGENGRGSHVVTVIASLVSIEQREIGGMQFSQLWRNNTPKLAGLESLTFSGQTGVGGGGSAIQIELNHPNQTLLYKIAQQVADKLSSYQGVIDINDGIELGKRQYNLNLSPQGSALGLTSAELSKQMRGFFFGIEALRQQRGENEMKVMVRLSKTERESLETLDQLTIKIPQGGHVPIKQLAYFNDTRAYTEIERTQGKRILAVTADINPQQANLNRIITEIKQNMMPEFINLYPGLRYSMEGDERARRDSLEFLKYAFLIALLFIYGLLAIPFKSYTQPLVVMLSIPFGIIGAFAGHLLLGYEISIISLIGIIGLTGIVINDSLVLIVTLNRLRTEHQSNPIQAAITASMRRLRPILLTSLTTCIGLMPMLFETSVQARFLIPMAISISFGILFATVIILALIPCWYLIIEDVQKLFSKRKQP